MRVCARSARPALAAALLAIAICFAARPAQASSALELVRMAKVHEVANEEEVAVRRYMEALALDATCEEAYLGLGALRERRGDLREADRVYSVAVERMPWFRPALAQRARVRRSLGFLREAVADLLASGEEASTLRTLAGWYGEEGQLPAQLSVWRKLLIVAESQSDAALAREARTMVRALVLVVGPADPAAAPPARGGVREVIATVARRGG